MPEDDQQDLHPYVEWLFTIDPVLATSMGDHRRDALLGETDPDAFADHDRRRSRWLADARSRPDPTPGSTAWLDRQVLITELSTAQARSHVEQVSRRAPYWYPERLGEALEALMDDPYDPVAGEALLARLVAVPDHLARAEHNLDPTCTPPSWAEMGEVSGRGLARFLGETVDAHADQLPGALAGEIRRAAPAAAAAAEHFAGFSGQLAGRASGEWACGRAHFDFLLHHLHHLDLDADGLADHGREAVERERGHLDEIATARDRDSSWHEQIDELKNWHPQPEQFLEVYGEAMDSAREHTVRAGLVTTPEDARCTMRWVPEYRRPGLPLGVMAPSAPYAPGLDSTFLITPVAADADAGARRQHMRDNCYLFATSIAGHETYPGHHLQAVHHKLSTPRWSIRRYFRTPQFVEGWGLYVEDLLIESGLLADDRLRLIAARNALWRALRIVVDVGLHTGAMEVGEAVQLMQREAGMDAHMATGEVRRYTRHDNPTYPSSYYLGRELIHRLRATHAEADPAGFSLRGFHDWLLGFGSPPLPLLSAMPASRGVDESSPGGV